MRNFGGLVLKLITYTFLKVKFILASLTPALSLPRRGRGALYGFFFIPSPPMGERVRVRGNKFACPLPFMNTLPYL
jgi:hypothetical protein